MAMSGLGWRATLRNGFWKMSDGDARRRRCRCCGLTEQDRVIYPTNICYTCEGVVGTRLIAAVFGILVALGAIFCR